MKRWFIIRWTVIIGGISAWWLWGVDWAAKQGSYHAVLLYLVLGVVGGIAHIYAVFRFSRMLRNVRRDEALGLADPGSTDFALNQRFRYLARSVEALLIVTVAIFGMVSLHNQGFARSEIYLRTVFTYLIGSVALTAYLTVRDVHVINNIRKQAKEDAATLRPILRYRSEEKTKEGMQDGSKQ